MNTIQMLSLGPWDGIGVFPLWPSSTTEAFNPPCPPSVLPGFRSKTLICPVPRSLTTLSFVFLLVL